MLAAAAALVVAAAPAVAASGHGCVVPRLHGDTLAQARQALARAGCRLGRVEGVKTGRVSAQSVPAGHRVVSGTSVAVALVAPAPKTGARTPTTLQLTASDSLNPGTFVILTTIESKGAAVDNGAPITFTIRDVTANKTLETFKGTAGIYGCAIDDSVEPGGLVRFYAPTGGCAIRPVTGSASHTFAITASFAGSARYGPSSSEATMTIAKRS